MILSMAILLLIQHTSKLCPTDAYIKILARFAGFYFDNK